MGSERFIRVRKEMMPPYLCSFSTRRLLSAVCVGSLAFAPSALADDYDWLGIGSFWSTSGNWFNTSLPIDVFTVPGPGDRASITGDGEEVLLDANITVDEIRLFGGAALNSNGFTLTVDQFGTNNSISTTTSNYFRLTETGTSFIDAKFGQATIQAQDRIDLQGGSELEIDNFLSLDGRLFGSGTVFMTEEGTGSKALTNNGVIAAGTSTQGGTLRITRNGTSSELDSDGTTGQGRLEVNANSTLDIELPIADAHGGTVTIRTGGTLNIDNPWTLDNTGVMLLQDFNPGTTSATLQGGEFTNRGTVRAFGVVGAVNVFEADYNQTIGRTDIGLGTRNFFLGKTTIGGVMEFDGNGGLVEFNGDTSIFGGTINTASNDELHFADPGGASVNSTSTLNITNNSTLRMSQSVAFQDADSIVLSSGGEIVLEGDAALSSVASWTHSGGDLTLRSGSGSTAAITGGQLTNRGTIIVDGGQAQIFADFTHNPDGLIELTNGGDLSLGLNSQIYGTINQTGTGSVLTIDGTALIDLATINVGQNQLVLDSTGFIDIESGADINVSSGQVTAKGRIFIRGADVLDFGSGGTLFIESGDTEIVDTTSDFDWDGGDGTTNTVIANGAGLEISTRFIDLGFSQHDGGIFNRGRLIVQVSGDEWIADGTLSLREGTLEGSTVRVTGMMEAVDDINTSANLSTATAGVIIANGGTLNIASNQTLQTDALTVETGGIVNVGNGTLATGLLGSSSTINDAEAIAFADGEFQVLGGTTTVNDTTGIFDWDGTGFTSTTIARDARLNINASAIDIGNNDHDGVIENRGILAVDVASDEWTAFGTLRLREGEVLGDTVRVNGTLEALDDTDTSFRSRSIVYADAIISSGSQVTLGPNSILQFNGETTLEGGSFAISAGSFLNFTGDTFFQGPDLITAGSFTLETPTPARIQADTTFDSPSYVLTGAGVRIEAGNTLTLDGNAELVAGLFGDGKVVLLGDMTARGFPSSIEANFDLGSGSGNTITVDESSLIITSKTISDNLGGPDSAEDVTVNFVLDQIGTLDIDLDGRSSWNLKGNLTLAGFYGGPGSLSQPRVLGDEIVLMNGKRITGSGEVRTKVTVDNGFLEPGQGFGNIGTLAFDEVDASAQAATMSLDLSYTPLGAVNDKIIFNDHVEFGGLLQGFFFTGYTPNVGDEWDVFDFGGTVAGEFDFLNLALLPDGMAWNLDELYTEGILRIFPEVLGDLDLDGDVDFDDINLGVGNFTGHLGSSSMTLAHGDYDFDGDVDNKDLGFILGAFTGPGAGGSQELFASASVPEPGSLALLTTAGLIAMRRRR